ncbi:MAG: hypothetical protein QOG69_797, partial [Actinomycetota bacterium]|nr:hypothetical protein [Actinomycetota bacterium]
MTDAAVVLIVDDEERNRRLLQMMLQAEGYVTLLAGDGREALDSVALHDVDLILLDVAMPGMNGYEVLQLIRADSRWDAMPVLMISGLDEISHTVRCIEAGAEDFLPK